MNDRRVARKCSRSQADRSRTRRSRTRRSRTRQSSGALPRSPKSGDSGYDAGRCRTGLSGQHRPTPRLGWALACCCLVAHASLIAAAADEPIDVGSRRELFVDRWLIERLDGAELQLQRPQSGGVALTLDRPWEGNLSGYFTVLRDGQQYRMYYRGRPLTDYGDGAEQAQEVTCVAESRDGKNWTRPIIGRFVVAGTKENNIVLANAAPITHNFAPFVDTRPGVPAAQRYKAVGGSSTSGLIAYVSADGLNWERLQERPIITGGAFDSQNNVFWSEHEQRYVCFFRTFRQ